MLLFFFIIFIKAFLFIFLLSFYSFCVDVIEDASEHTSLYDHVENRCYVGPWTLHILYKLRGGDKHKVYVSLAFKLDIPKGATINKAVFTCTTTESLTLPTYEIYFRRSKPENTIEDFLKICKYKTLKLASQYVIWDDIVVDGDEVSSTEIAPLVSKFIQDSKYNPGIFFQLIILNPIAGNKKPENEEQIKCYNYNNDIKKRPRLYIEWSV